MGHIREGKNIRLVLEELMSLWFQVRHKSVNWKRRQQRRKGKLKWSWKSIESKENIMLLQQEGNSNCYPPEDKIVPGKYGST